jgi:hypothetical protein
MLQKNNNVISDGEKSKTNHARASNYHLFNDPQLRTGVNINKHFNRNHCVRFRIKRSFDSGFNGDFNRFCSPRTLTHG